MSGAARSGGGAAGGGAAGGGRFRAGGGIADGRTWTVGDVFVLRHAGMPFDWLEALGAPDELLSAADALLDAQARLRVEARAAGVAPRAADAAVSAGDPDLLPGGGPERWQEAVRRWAEAQAAYHKEFEAADRDATDELRRLLAHPDVAEAVFLSNPDVYANMLLPFLERPRPANARWRRVRRQLYTYLQRFCAKNETVSFFGPMAYGTARPGTDVVLRTGLPRRRSVFLAHWAARELANAIGRDTRLRGALPFRRTGVPLPDADRDLEPVLGSGGACLAEVARGTGTGMRECALRLRRLVAAGCLEFGVPPEPSAVDALADMLRDLAGLPESGPAVADWSGRLTALRDLLVRLRDAPLPERVDLVGQLERAFTEATGRPARRAHGAVYADRAVFYEECSSPFALQVGTDVLREWAGRLAPALEVCVAHGHRTQQAAVREVLGALGERTVLPLPEYARRLLAPFDPGGSRFAAAHAPEYPAERSPEVVRELRVAAAGLPGDRYAVIDVCLAGRYPGELREAELVLSRCHHHLLTPGWLGTMFPARDEAGCTADGTGGFGQRAAQWVAGRPDLVGLDAGRRNKGYYLFPGRRLVLRPPSRVDARDAGVLWPDRVSVEVDRDRLRATDDTGREIALYLPLSDQVKYPPYAALSHPQVLHAAFRGPAATPVVAIGGVVYQRARWFVDAAALADRTPAGRFLRMRRLARDSGTGRFVFCRTEHERKPYLVDLASVLAADLVGHLAGHGGTLTAEQMWPPPDRLWLRDEDGRRYTCELRMQVVGSGWPA